MRKILFSILILCSFSSFAQELSTVIGNVGLDLNPNKPIVFPKNLNNVPEILISRKQYLISFNPDTRLLNWVAWRLTPGDLGHVGRTNQFELDNDLEKFLLKINKHAVSLDDYLNSCFDRGHQVPSADRDDSIENNLETFKLSNIIPQTGYLNRIIWEHLEAYSRDLVNKENKSLFLIAGPIYDLNYGKTGLNNDIIIPSKNFKIISSLDGTIKMSVIMPNILSDGTAPTDHEKLCNEKNLTNVSSDKNDWKKYLTNIEEINRLSHFTFSY